MSVNPYGTSFKTLSDSLSFYEVVGPDGGAESHFGVVGAVDDFFFFGPRKDWKDGT
jgi:hypothetical protein